MDKSQAIKSIAAEIHKDDTDLYLFQPPGQTEKFFIGETVLIAAATVLLTAFMKGIESSLQPRAQKWGEALGTWLADRLQSLFRSKAKPVADDDLDRIITDASTALAKASPEKRSKVAAEVQRVLEDILQGHKVDAARAAALAASASRAGLALAAEPAAAART